MMRTWWENEEILAQFRCWLSQTAQEVDALPDETAPACSTIETGGSPVMANTEHAENAGEPPAATAEALPEIGLLHVVEALTAMRHELKLQTKGSRSLEEAVNTARQGLDAAIRQFQSVQAREQQSADRAALPLVEAMAGLDEALWRGAKAFLATHRQMTETAPQRLGQLLDDEFHRLSRWRRWLARGWHAQVQRQCAAAMARANDEEFARLIEGYRLIQNRIRQELELHGLRRLETTGRPVDPACMTVVELADPSEGPPETVVEELRPGYSWHEKVIRFAEVRAVASRGD